MTAITLLCFAFLAESVTVSDGEPAPVNPFGNAPQQLYQEELVEEQPLAADPSKIEPSTASRSAHASMSESPLQMVWDEAVVPEANSLAHDAKEAVAWDEGDEFENSEQSMAEMRFCYLRTFSRRDEDLAFWVPPDGRTYPYNMICADEELYAYWGPGRARCGTCKDACIYEFSQWCTHVAYFFDGSCRIYHGFCEGEEGEDFAPIPIRDVKNPDGSPADRNFVVFWHNATRSPYKTYGNMTVAPTQGPTCAPEDQDLSRCKSWLWFNRDELRPGDNAVVVDVMMTIFTLSFFN